MPKVISGQLSKMTHKEGTPVQYFLNLGEDSYPLTSKVGQIVNIKYTGKITCVECGRKIKKTYSDGYCFPCARDLPENDICSVRPEKCQHDKGNEADQEFRRLVGCYGWLIKYFDLLFSPSQLFERVNFC